MNFEDRLKAAVVRGQKRSDSVAREAAARALTEEDFRRLHGQLRLALSEQIESCLHRLPNYFPGFRYETIFGERGWGGACWREDLRLERGVRSNEYSRLEITVRLDEGRTIVVTQPVTSESFAPGDRVRIVSGGRAARVVRLPPATGGGMRDEGGGMK